MAWFKTLLTFSWMKDWRTFAITAFVVAAYGVENILGIDIPGVNITWEMVLIALGLSTAATHDAKK